MSSTFLSINSFCLFAISTHFTGEWSQKYRQLGLKQAFPLQYMIFHGIFLLCTDTGKYVPINTANKNIIKDQYKKGFHFKNAKQNEI